MDLQLSLDSTTYYLCELAQSLKSLSASILASEMWGNNIPYKTIIVRTKYNDVCKFGGITSDTQCLINDTFHCFFASLPSLHSLAISSVSYSHLYSDSHTRYFLTLCCCLRCFLHKECPALHFCLFHCILPIVMTPPRYFSLQRMGSLIQPWEFPVFCRDWLRKLYMATKK